MMKIAVTPPDDHQYSIMQRIIDGSLYIDSIEEFEEILEMYPDDPLLYRKYADLLILKNEPLKGQQAYHRAAELFIAQGMNLQAIVAKILQWSIRKPSHEEGRTFHALLHEEGARQTPLQRFWARMTYAELVTVMLRLVRQRIASGEKVMRMGDAADNMFFVVSGCLAENPSPDCEDEAATVGFETEPILLGANDIFGDIFPLDQPTVAQAETSALTETELVKIAKPVLYDACQKYPNIERLLSELHRPKRQYKCDRAWQTVRRAMRFGLPTKVDISMQWNDGDAAEWIHTGIAVDLSLGGMCVDLGSQPFGVKEVELKGQSVQLNLDLLNEVADLQLDGRVVWQKVQNTEKGPATLVGIRFDTLNAVDRELLAEYCAGSASEQNLLWSLWDAMVRSDKTVMTDAGSSE